jgi:hypothetical protein
VVDLAREILRNPTQLLIGNHAAQALHDSRDAGHFPGRTAGFRADDVALFAFPVGRAIAIQGYQGRRLICARRSPVHPHNQQPTINNRQSTPAGMSAKEG